MVINVWCLKMICGSSLFCMCHIFPNFSEESVKINAPKFTLQTTRFLQFFLIPFYPPPTQWGCGQHTSPPCLPPVAESPAVDFQFPSFCEVRRYSVVSGQFLDPVQLLPERTNVQVSSFWALAFQNWKNPKITKWN